MHSFIHSFIHSCFHSFNHSLILAFIRSFSFMSFHSISFHFTSFHFIPFIHWFLGSFGPSVLSSFIDSLTHSLIHSPTNSSFHCSMHWFPHYFTYSFIVILHCSIQWLIYCIPSPCHPPLHSLICVLIESVNQPVTHSVSRAFILSCPVSHRHLNDHELHNLNISLLQYLTDIPIGHWFLIAIVFSSKVPLALWYVRHVM
jgi:hypothetical protein